MGIGLCGSSTEFFLFRRSNAVSYECFCSAKDLNSSILSRYTQKNFSDLPPGRASFITRTPGVDRHLFQVWQAGRAGCPQIAHALSALLTGSGSPAIRVA
jgi:hypothetical protein